MPTERGYKRWTDKEKERERERVSGPFCGPPSLPLFPCPSFFLLSFRRNCGGCLTGRSGEGDVGTRPVLRWWPKLAQCGLCLAQQARVIVDFTL